MPPTKPLTLYDIYYLALKAGLGDEGAKVAMAIAKTENGLGGAVGDRSIGGSYGPFQFYTGGRLPAYAKDKGLSVQMAGEYARANPVDAATWALNGYLGAAIRDGLQKGLSGPKLATYAQQTGQISVDPGRAGQNYQALFSENSNPLAGGGRMIGDPGGVDDTIYQLHKQKLAERAEVSASRNAWVDYLAMQRKKLGEFAGIAGEFEKGSPDYAVAVSEAERAKNIISEYTTRYNELTNDIQRLTQDYIAANAKFKTDSRNADLKTAAATLAAQKDYLAEAVALGKINTEQARLAWGEAQQTADNWTKALGDAYRAASTIAPMLATQEDMDTLWADIQGMKKKSGYGDGTALSPKIIQLGAVLDPYMKQIANYLPPPSSIDWQKAMTVPSGLGTPTISQGDYLAGALGQVERPVEPKALESGEGLPEQSQPPKVAGVGATSSAPSAQPQGGISLPGANPENSLLGANADSWGAWDAMGAASGGGSDTGTEDETVRPLPGGAVSLPGANPEASKIDLYGPPKMAYRKVYGAGAVAPPDWRP